MDIKNQKKKRGVRVSKTLAVFARLAFTSPGKKCDKQLTHIVRVMLRHLFNYHELKQVLSYNHFPVSNIGLSNSDIPL